HVLHLLGAAGEPVAGAPASYLKPCELGFDRPLAPAHPALERDRGLLEPDAAVFAHLAENNTEVPLAREPRVFALVRAVVLSPPRVGPPAGPRAAGAGRCGQQVVELRRAPFGEA